MLLKFNVIRITSQTQKQQEEKRKHLTKEKEVSIYYEKGEKFLDLLAHSNPSNSEKLSNLSLSLVRLVYLGHEAVIWNGLWNIICLITEEQEGALDGTGHIAS